MSLQQVFLQVHVTKLEQHNLKLWDDSSIIFLIKSLIFVYVCLCMSERVRGGERERKGEDAES